MFARPSVALYLQVKELLKIGVSHIAIRLAGCPSFGRLSRGFAHVAPTRSASRSEPFRRVCRAAARPLPTRSVVPPELDNAKLVNIFHTTKYFDKNFQNIFNFFLPAQGKSFSCPESQIFLIFERL